MPTVPAYSTAQVEDRALPGVRTDSVATPDLLGSQGDTMLKLGAGEMAAGTGLDAIAVHMQARDNLQKVQAATTDYGQRVLDWRMDMEKNRTGAAAAGAVSDFSDFHKKTIEEVSKGLGNDAQRQAFGVMANKAGLAQRHDVGTFEVAQTRKANASADAAAADNWINQGAAAITSEAALEAKTNLVNSTRAYLATQNVEKEVEDAVVSARLTKFHAQRIQQLARTDPDSAAVYFKNNEGEIAGSQRAEIGAFADKATAASMGGRMAADVWATMGPKGDTDVSRVDQMAAKIREDLKDKPEAMHVALTTLHSMDAERDKGIKAADDSSKAKVNTMLLNNMPLAQVMRTPEFAALKDPRSVVLHEESIGAARESRAAARESRAYTAEQRADHTRYVNGLDKTMQLSNPDALVAMSRDQVINLLPTLGRENTIGLLNKWDAYTKNGTLLSEAKIDNNQFNTFATSAGFKPLDTKQSPEDKERISNLRDNIERMVGQEQMAKKRPLTRDEKDTIMQREIDKSVMLHNTVFRDVKTPQIAVQPEDFARAYVNVGDKQVYLKDVPAAFRVEATTELRKRNKPVSEQEIARLWLRSKEASGKADQVPQ